MKKGRYWASVGYPESLPKNWIEKLTETGLQIAISPLHNMDKQPDGTSKKEHYHIIFCYDGPTTFKHVKELCEELNMTIPIKLERIKGMYRYHLHLDDPDKYQYDDRDRILLGGFDTSIVNELTTTEVNKILKELQIFIQDNFIYEYATLMDLLLENDLTNMHDVALRHTIFLNTYITSRRNSCCKRKEEE